MIKYQKTTTDNIIKSNKLEELYKTTTKTTTNYNQILQPTTTKYLLLKKK